MTTGQAIREALNARIDELDGQILAVVRARTGWTGDLVERIDELTEFRITVNRILHEAGELGDGRPAL